MSTTSLFGENLHRISLGGIIRAGGFTLTDSAKEEFQTDMAFDEKEIDNTIGKFYFAEYAYGRFGIGFRWMSYQLEGESDTLDQSLTLDYSLVTISATLIEGDFLHPDLVNRFGLTVGKGQSSFELRTKTSQALALQTIDETEKSDGDAEYLELYFEAMTQSGWGYRLAAFILKTKHDKKTSGIEPDGSSKPSGYITILWQY